jgi:hypothetical protein
MIVRLRARVAELGAENAALLANAEQMKLCLAHCLNA